MNMQQIITTDFIYQATICYTELLSLCNLYTKNNEDFNEHFNSISRSKQIEIAKSLINYNLLDFFKTIITYIEDFDIRLENDILIILAARTRSIAAVKYFISHQLDVCVLDNYIICNCITADYTNDLLIELINHGANVNAQNGTPLVNVIKESAIKNFETLIKNGADYTLDNNKAVYAASLLKYKSESVFLSYFINMGIDVNMENSILLQNSVSANNFDSVKLLLENGANILNLLPRQLYCTIKNMDINIIKLLLEYAVDFSILNDLPYPFYLDIVNMGIDNLTMAHLLYDIFSSPTNNFKYDIGCNYLNFIRNSSSYYINNSSMDIRDIISKDNLCTVEELDKLFIDINDSLKRLVSRDRLDIIKQIMEIKDIDLRFENDILLKIAISYNIFNMVLFLIEHDLDIHAEENIEICCSVFPDGKMLQYLIDCGVKVNSDKFIILATEANMVPCIKILISNGCNIYAENGRPIINLIQNNMNCETIFKFLELEIDVNYGSGIFLKTAIGKNNREMIQMLLGLGASIEYLVADDYKNLIRIGDTKLMNVFVDHGADFSILNSYIGSDTAIEYVALLLNNNVSIEIIINAIFHC